MRMWMIEPKLMCRKHLLGEHFEIHKMVGNLKKSGRWVMNLVKKGFLDPSKAQKRHNELVEEMIRRGYNHNSPLKFKSDIKGKIDIKKSIQDLKKRCNEYGEYK